MEVSVAPSMRIAFLTRDLKDNSTGRTYCLWELAKANGWSAVVLSFSGEDVWSPLQGSDFAEACKKISPSELEAELIAFAPDLIVAVKPLEQTLGVAWPTGAKLSIPVLLDIDDPDLEIVLTWSDPLRRMKRAVMDHRKVRQFKRLRRLASQVPRMVSNPELQRRYGGIIIPHIRTDAGLGLPHVRTNPRVAFVGTNRPHKGLHVLREAVRLAQDVGTTLVVTDRAPSDAYPWEEWVGNTSLGEGLDLVAGCDVVALPSLDDPRSRGQFPVKLVDAMLAGRAIVVSDVPPLEWAVGNAGLIVRSSAVDVARAMREFADPQVRQRYGWKARERALEEFTLAANTDRFRRVCLDAVRLEESPAN